MLKHRRNRSHHWQTRPGLRNECPFDVYRSQKSEPAIDRLSGCTFESFGHECENKSNETFGREILEKLSETTFNLC